jgi:peptidoglycan/xylan/chitin deacetylase (PgdA/CDA1 family)
MSQSIRGSFRPLVLCYHAVSDSWEHQLAVEPSVLERQVRYLLRRGFSPVSAQEVAAGRGKLLHVTFDDGFHNVFGALEIFDRLGVRASVYACTSCAEDGRPFDGGNLADEARAHPEELATMSWDDLRGLAERGVEVGSHTSTHPRLSQLEDAELARELQESKQRLEDELGRPCNFIAYPYGDEDERVRAATRAAGYLGAFSLPGRQRRVTVYSLPRVGIYRGDNVRRAAMKATMLGRYAAYARVAGRYRR